MLVRQRIGVLYAVLLLASMYVDVAKAIQVREKPQQLSNAVEAKAATQVSADSSNVAALELASTVTPSPEADTAAQQSAPASTKSKIAQAFAIRAFDAVVGSSDSGASSLAEVDGSATVSSDAQTQSSASATATSTSASTSAAKEDNIEDDSVVFEAEPLSSKAFSQTPLEKAEDREQARDRLERAEQAAAENENENESSDSGDAESASEDSEDSEEYETEGLQQRQTLAGSRPEDGMRFAQNGNIFKKVVNGVKNLFKKPAPKPAPAAPAKPQAQIVAQPQQQQGPEFIPWWKMRAQDIEDCCACRYVWNQVTRDVAEARDFDEVHASLEQNCMEAQKSSIFFNACADMYDDSMAMVDDYMAGVYNVDQLCQRAKFCPGWPKDETNTCEKFWKIRGCNALWKLEPFRQAIDVPCSSVGDCEIKCCKKQPIVRPPDLSKFLVQVHFINGYDQFQLFDYFKEAKSGDKANAGQYQFEFRNFPDAIVELKRKLERQKKPFPTPVRLHIAGYASVLGKDKPNYLLSERRAMSMACYVAQWLQLHVTKDFSLLIGYYGESRATGSSPKAQANDRRVDVVFPSSKLAAKMKIDQKWHSGSQAANFGDGGMSAYCKQTSKWQNKGFDRAWLMYGGPAAKLGAAKPKAEIPKPQAQQKQQQQQQQQHKKNTPNLNALKQRK